MQFNRILKKIIRTGVGKSRYWMAIIGLGVAMLLILVALQVHTDFNELLHGSRNQNERADYLVVNKLITNDMMGKPEKTVFTPEEQKDFAAQPFVEAFGAITAAQFNVQMQADQLGFQTLAFFEAVPDTFLDVKSDEWKWREGDQMLPIVVPRDFVNMFNFGFALGNGIPQFSETSIKSLTPEVIISNGMQQGQFRGKIAGFSDRISTVLVPQSFMDWANARYGKGVAKLPSRVVIRVKDPSSIELKNYLEQHNYSTDSEKTKYNKIRGIVQTIVSVVGFFGGVLLMFALLVFSMFIQLVISSCRKEIRLLVTLGTAPKRLQRYLLGQLVPVYFVTGVIALIVVSAAQWWASGVLAKHGMFVAPYPGIMTIVATLGILALVYVVNLVTVRKEIQAHT
ncbi:FtsX-like permease family protein [Chitinophaga rhizosphaerae]|uniref:FtsX-like permease family protein n=1 Tax=Chitinophaga rhizosphaerae TaxID=1864947 RepID=UPI000F80B341|nr:ABC transporter permease [Chitinophaga rhizosphaerae]